MRNRVTFGILATVAVTAIALSTPAWAGKKKTDLVSAGYKCERVGVNFIECTKDGETTYWCDDAGNCEAKPARVRGGEFRAPLNGGLLEVNPGLGTNPPRGFGSAVGTKAPPVQLR